MENSLIVRREVYQRAVRNEAKSTLEAPVYEIKVYINFVRANGDQFSRPLYPKEYDRKLSNNPPFAVEYEAFLKSQSAVTEGFPIGELIGITVAEVATLKEIGVITVEGLSACPRVQVEGLDSNGRYVQLRDFAVAFLAQRRDMDQLFALKKKNEELEIENLRLKGAVTAAETRVSLPKTLKEDAPGELTVDDEDVFRQGAPKRKPVVEVRK